VSTLLRAHGWGSTGEEMDTPGPSEAGGLGLERFAGSGALVKAGARRPDSPPRPNGRRSFVEVGLVQVPETGEWASVHIALRRDG